jgi:hypothetical protein
MSKGATSAGIVFEDRMGTRPEEILEEIGKGMLGSCRLLYISVHPGDLFSRLTCLLDCIIPCPIMPCIR